MSDDIRAEVSKQTSLLKRLLQKTSSTSESDETQAIFTDIKGVLTDILNRDDTIITELQLIKTELLNDDSPSSDLFEDPLGVVVVRLTKIDDAGAITITYTNQDGTSYLGDVNLLIPYSRQLIQSVSDYCASGVPYSLFQYKDADDINVITATIWRDDSTLLESVTAPVGYTKGLCEAVSTDILATYDPPSIPNGLSDVNVSVATGVILGNTYVISLTTNLTSFPNVFVSQVSVSADNQISHTIINQSGSAVDLPLLTFRIKAI